MQHRRLAVNVIQYDIEATVAVEVCNRKAATAPTLGQCAARSGSNLLEFPIGGISEKQRLLGVTGPPLILIDRGIYMTICDNQVFPAIVVKIKKAGSPPKKRNSYLAKSGRESNISKITACVVVVQDIRVVGKVCDVEIDTTIIVIITDREAHARLFATIFVQCNPRRVAGFLERSVALVDVELF